MLEPAINKTMDTSSDKASLAQLPELLDWPPTFPWPEPKDIAVFEPIIVRLFRLAQREWTRRSIFERNKVAQRCTRRALAAVEKLPLQVRESTRATFKGEIGIEILPFIMSAEGNRFDGQVLAGVRYAVGQDPTVLAVSIYLLFAPEEVLSQIVVHELAHCFLRASGRTFEPGGLKEGDGLCQHYSTKSATEELEVDRLVDEWGFGRRHLYFDAWVYAVRITNNLDCLKEYRAQLKCLKKTAPLK